MNNNHSFDIRDFGATENSGTTAIQAAIDAAAVDGGVVEIPPGRFRSGTIFLKSGVELRLSRGAVLTAIDDLDEFPDIKPPIPSRMDVCPWKAFIYAVDAENIALTGGGTISPGGELEIFQNGIVNSPSRPYGIHFVRCSDILVSGVTMTGSAFWMQRYFNCEKLRINGISVFNHCNLNNDGLDIDCCRDVIVSDCRIDADDDALCVKTEGAEPSSDITVSNCVVSSHASAIKLGTGSVGDFKNIVISNCVVKPSKADHVLHPRGLKGGTAGVSICAVDGAKVENVLIDDIRIDGVESPLFVRLGKRLSRMDELDGAVSRAAGNGRWKNAPPKAIGSIRGLTLRNISATDAGPVASSISACEGGAISGLILDSISISASKTPDAPVSEDVPENDQGYPSNLMFGSALPAAGIYLRNLERVVLKDVRVTAPTSDRRPAIRSLNCRDMDISG